MEKRRGIQQGVFPGRMSMLPMVVGGPFGRFRGVVGLFRRFVLPVVSFVVRRGQKSGRVLSVRCLLQCARKGPFQVAACCFCRLQID